MERKKQHQTRLDHAVTQNHKYFTLDLDSLRAVAGWAADCAEQSLPVYTARAGADDRLREAIKEIRCFAAGGKRTARLRTLACAAHAAGRESGSPAAAAAARAVGAAAASAYTHPLVDVHQTKHIVGAAAYAALALELDHGENTALGDEAVRKAVASAPHAAGEVLLHMPARAPGKSRLAMLLYEADTGLRSKARFTAGRSA